MADENDPDDDENYFGELLDKRGPDWLKKQLEALGLKLDPATPPKDKPASGGSAFETFLHGEVAAARKEASTLRERLEAVLDVLTPEQRTLLKSASGEPPKDKKPNGRTPPRQSPEPEPKPKRSGFLSRL